MFTLLKPLSQGLVLCFSLPCTLFKGWVFFLPLFLQLETIKDSHVSFETKRGRSVVAFQPKSMFAPSRPLIFNMQPEL